MSVPVSLFASSRLARCVFSCSCFLFVFFVSLFASCDAILLFGVVAVVVVFFFLNINCML